MFDRAKYVRLYNPKRTMLENGGVRIECTAKSRATRDNPKPQKRRTVVETLDGSPKVTRSKGVKVSCDCENFMFTWEVALYRVGAADLIYSNGERPMVTNPGMYPYVCKHVLRLLQAVKSKGY